MPRPIGHRPPDAAPGLLDAAEMKDVVDVEYMVEA